MRRVVWIQLDEDEVYHAISQAAAYSTDADFETLCQKVGWSWLNDDVEGDEGFTKCATCELIANGSA